MAKRAGWLVVAVVVVAAACGAGDRSGGDGAAVSGRGDGVADLPEGEVVVAVAATERHGWVLTSASGGGAGRLTMSRVEPSGETTEVGTLRGGGVRLASNGSEVFVTASVCEEGGNECDDGRASLWVFDEHGMNVDGAEVEPGEGSGASIVGTAGEDVWVATDHGLTRMSPEGENLETAEQLFGLACVVEGRLFATSAPPSLGSGVVSSGDAEEAIDYTLFEWLDEAWREVDGAVLTVRPLEELSCTPDGIERFAYDGDPSVPNAFWTPQNGLVPVVVSDVVPDSSNPAVLTPNGELYVVDEADGRFMVRAPGMATFEHRPGVRTETEGGRWALPTYDASPALEIQCAPPSAEQRSPAACEVSPR